MRNSAPVAIVIPSAARNLLFFLNFALKNLLAFALLLLSTCAAAQSYETVYSAQLRNGFSIRHYTSKVIGDKTRLYLSRDSEDSYAEIPTSEITSIESEQIALPAAPTVSRPQQPNPKPIPELITTAATITNIDPDFIASVIHAESGFNPHARSPKGAQGLMQLMPQTATKLGVSNAYDPEANVKGGSEYLRQLLAQYHGDAQKALAAYNAGPQRVQQYKGVPPYRETRTYVARVINEYNRKKRNGQKSSAPKQN
jgi:soluble lytic murein transglycosylase-like protein